MCSPCIQGFDGSPFLADSMKPLAAEWLLRASKRGDTINKDWNLDFRSFETCFFLFSEIRLWYNGTYISIDQLQSLRFQTT